MNCPYFMGTNACCEISGLFDKLNIPQQERLVLLKMAKNRLDCVAFKRILSNMYLYKRKIILEE